MKLVGLVIYFAALIWSAINPYDYFTCFFGSGVGAACAGDRDGDSKAFPLSPLAHVLILIHCLFLFGVHYSYAEVDTFRFMRDWFGWQRNNYDKLGRFAQGFVPASVAGEILIRFAAVKPRLAQSIRDFDLPCLQCLR